MRNQPIIRLVMGVVAMGLLCTSAKAEDPKPAAEGGVSLFNGKDLTGWTFRNTAAKDTWKVVSAVALDAADPKKLVGTGEGGTDDAILFRQPVAHGSDLYTKQEFGDCELHIEFMVPRESNSGVYLLGRYEIQVFDSFGKPDNKLGAGDCGGIYATKAPSVNASKAPGEWQSFDVVFRAARFDASGKKTENAKFISVIQNGRKIQENVDVPKPTGGEMGPDKATGPLLLQGDHGVVAYRNIRIKSL